MCRRSVPPAVSKNKTKKIKNESRSLNVFRPTPPLYYNNGVCQHKRGAALYVYIFGTMFSDCDFFFYFVD